MLRDGELLVWAATLGGSAAGAVVAQLVLFGVLKRVARKSPLTSDLLARTSRPTSLVAAAFAAYLAVFGSPLSDAMGNLLRHALALVLIAGIAWILVRVVHVVVDSATQRYVVDVSDNLHARKARTQLLVLQRVAVLGVCLLAFAAALTTFAQVRALGASILASAGVIGIVVGVAAQSTLGNLVAGIQIAVTEPLKLDDVVVVEEEWGKVEEITLTYVVVRIWDQRRLVLPISYFVQNPFQNWTRRTANLLGSVFVYVDYTVEVGSVRRELRRILESSGVWDGEVFALQVTDATERIVELRALMSAPDSASAWDLRCHVRERLIDYLQRVHPESLPKGRAEVVLDRASEPDRRIRVDA